MALNSSLMSLRITSTMHMCVHVSLRIGMHTGTLTSPCHILCSCCTTCFRQRRLRIAPQRRLLTAPMRAAATQPACCQKAPVAAGDRTRRNVAARLRGRIPRSLQVSFSSRRVALHPSFPPAHARCCRCCSLENGACGNVQAGTIL